MAIASSIFWIAGFILSVVMAPSIIIWTWGPTMLCFAAATALALPNIWREGMGKFNLYILITGLATAVWIAWRAYISPAKELALMDLTLVAMAVSTFIVLRNAFRSSSAQAIIISGIALLLAANLGIMFAEYHNPDYNFLIPFGTRTWPSGFYRHYSHCAAFLIVTSLLLAGFGMRSSWPLLCRIGLLLLAVTGLIAVYFTKSRSGLIGAGCGLLILIVYWIFTAKRDDKKWSGLALILVPIILLGLLSLFFPLLTSVQQTRSADTNLIDMMDNNMRLILYGISLPCIFMHPFIGGGSRSFSWECYQFWDVESMGVFTADPQHVHNELLQVVTDYGIIGALVLLAFIVGVWVCCSYRSLVKGRWSHYPNADAWRIGGIAAFIGLFAQSNFEGILRTAPGAILLAICLAAASHELASYTSIIKKHFWLRRLSLTISCLIAICIMSFYGFKGTNVAVDLWPNVLLKPSASHEDKISAYTRGLKKWNLESLHSERGILYYELAFENTSNTNPVSLFTLALEDYKAASLLHPYTPLHPRNAANTLSVLYQFNEALTYYEKAIQLQGGMEPLYKTHFYYANHLHQMALHQLQTGKYPDSVKTYELALSHLDKTPAYIHGAPFYELQTFIHINLGTALQNNGEYDKALSQFEALNLIRGSNIANYYVAVMFYSRAKTFKETQRPSDALRLFIEAENRLKTNPELPKSFSGDVRAKLIEEIRKQILELQAEKHLPSEEIRLN